MITLSTEYKDYIQSEAWNQKRLERLRLDAYVCQDCGVSDKPLDVHHLSYIHFGDERLDDLLSVCRRCHNFRHGEVKILFFNCPTCLQFLPITVQKIRIMKHDLIKYVCADGHVRTYNATDTN